MELQSELQPASSSWRKNILNTGKRFKTKLINFEVMQDRSIDTISTAVSHNKSNHLVIFDTTPKKDVMRVVKLGVKDTSSATNTKDNKDKDKDILGGKRVNWSVVNDTIQESSNCIKSATWLDQHLLCGGLDGNVYLYNCDPSTIADKEPELQETYTITRLQGLKETKYAIGSAAESTAIRGVSFNKQSPNIFACVENASFHIWDIANPVQPSVSFRTNSESPMYSLDWAHHSRNYCAVGGGSHSLYILDQRQLNAYKAKRSPISWQSDKARGDITSVSWHPFIPYWMAAATDMGTIEIFDIRSINTPVISYYAHNGPVSNIKWCPSHSELMVSTGYDCSYKMWSLTKEPNYLLFQKDETTPYIYSNFFESEGYSNFGVNVNGEITYSSIHQKFMNPIIQSRFQKSEIAEQRVERLIYNREFTSGFEKAIILANKHSRSDNIDKAHTLLSLCFQQNIEDSLSDVLKSTGQKVDMKKVFLKDLESYSYFIPFSYYEKFNTKLSTNLMTKIKDLKINLDIQKHIKNCSGDELIEIEREIISTLRGDHLSIRLETIVDVVQVLLGHNATKCYSFVMQLADIFKNKLTFMTPILRILLYPTIFESQSNTFSPPPTPLESSGNQISPPQSQLSSSSTLPSPGSTHRNSVSTTTAPSPSPALRNSGAVPTTPKSATSTPSSTRSTASMVLKDPLEVEDSKINEHLPTAESIIQQLQFMSDFTKILLGPMPVSDGSLDQEDIIDYAGRNRPTVLLSKSINRIYLSILAESFIYDQFYNVLLNLLNACQGFDLHGELIELYDAFTPDFLSFIKGSQQRDRSRQWDSERFSIPLLTAISILQNVLVTSQPTDFYEVLSTSIPIFIEELDNSFLSMLQQPDPSNPLPGKVQAQQKSKALFDMVKSITDKPQATIKKPVSLTSSSRVSSTSLPPQVVKANMQFQSQLQSLNTVLNKYMS